MDLLLTVRHHEALADEAVERPVSMQSLLDSGPLWMPERRRAILHQMPVAWVGDDGSGGYWAHVDYDDPGPFAFLRGPGPVSVEEGLAWARRHAKRVVVREGNHHYSAGAEPVQRFPRWAGPDAGAFPSPETGRTAGLEAYRVEARTGWYRRDGESVARGLAEAAERDWRATDATTAVRDRGFSVSFTVASASELEGHAVAHAVLRGAWAALEIEAVPGDEF